MFDRRPFAGLPSAGCSSRRVAELCLPAVQVEWGVIMLSMYSKGGISYLFDAGLHCLLDDRRFAPVS